MMTAMQSRWWLVSTCALAACGTDNDGLAGGVRIAEVTFAAVEARRVGVERHVTLAITESP